MQIALLTEEFFQKHQGCEVLLKHNRPYIIIYSRKNKVTYAVPLRSHLRMDGFFTDADHTKGADYKKTLIVTERDVQKNKRPYVEDSQYRALRDHAAIIERGVDKFIETYKKARTTPDRAYAKIILNTSTIQYFHTELEIQSVVVYQEGQEARLDALQKYSELKNKTLKSAFCKAYLEAIPGDVKNSSAILAGSLGKRQHIAIENMLSKKIYSTRQIADIVMKYSPAMPKSTVLIENEIRFIKKDPHFKEAMQKKVCR